MDHVLRAVGSAATEANPGVRSERPLISFHGFRSDGHYVNLGHPGMAVLAECHESLTRESLRRAALTATTDLRAFHFHGAIAGTCYGPRAENIHGVNERVDLQSVLHTLRAYALFLCRWCTVEPV